MICIYVYMYICICVCVCVCVSLTRSSLWTNPSARSDELFAAAARFMAFIRWHLKIRAMGAVSKVVDASIPGGLQRRIGVALFGHGRDPILPNWITDEKIIKKLKRYRQYNASDHQPPYFRANWSQWLAPVGDGMRVKDGIFFLRFYTFSEPCSAIFKDNKYQVSAHDQC